MGSTHGPDDWNGTLGGLGGQVNAQKLKELMLYVAKRSEDDPRFGAIKLNKILFYADFAAYRELGKSITEANYYNLEEGPVPKALFHLRDELLDRGEARLVKEVSFGHEQVRLIANREPSMDLFDPAEIAIVDRVIKMLWPLNNTEASRKSHREFGWKLTNRDELIPYTTAWIGSGTPSEEIVQWGREVARRHESARGSSR